MPASTSIDDRDMGMDALLAEIESEGGFVDIGLHSDEDEEMLQKGIDNEFGTNRIPSRPFIRATIDQNEGLFLKHAETLSGNIIDKKINKLEALTEMGMLIKGETQRYMINLKSPPNAPSTIKKKKGQDNPLIDKGDMVGSIDYDVKPGKSNV